MVLSEILDFVCPSCKKVTKTMDRVLEKGAKVLNILGVCKECGKKKKKSITIDLLERAMKTLGKKGFQKLANFLRKPDGTRVRKLKMGEFHFGKHSFTGPNTRIDLPEVRNFPPINNIDACSKKHDIALAKAIKIKNKTKKNKAIRKADNESLDCFRLYKNENGALAALTGINAKIGLENVSPSLAKQLLGNIAGGR